MAVMSIVCWTLPHNTQERGQVAMLAEYWALACTELNTDVIFNSMLFGPHHLYSEVWWWFICLKDGLLWGFLGLPPVQIVDCTVALYSKHHTIVQHTWTNSMFNSDWTWALLWLIWQWPCFHTCFKIWQNHQRWNINCCFVLHRKALHYLLTKLIVYIMTCFQILVWWECVNSICPQW